MTDATSHQDCATLHRLMLQVDMGGWGILPLQYVLDPWYASVRERHWWFVFKKWACNDVPPGICSPDSPQRSRGWLNQRVLAILQGIRDAKRIRDFAKLKWLQHDLRDLASKLSVPLYVVGTVVVPNLTPNQKAAIHRVCRKLVGSVVGAAWEKQALNKAIRITRSTPQTVRVFERKARQYDKLQAQPPCSCHQASNIPGTRIIIDGHVALCPIAIPYHDGSTARPNDPLPLNGHKVRQQLLQDLTTMAHQIGATLPPPLTYLPPALWPESGARLRSVVQLADQVTKHFYVRIVDKGVGVMWGFCRHWVWGVLQKFLADEGYTPAPGDPSSTVSAIRSDIMRRGWEMNEAGQLAILYLIGKAKSLTKGTWLWRGITALPHPFLPKRNLKVAARAKTTFLRCLSDELPCPFLAHSINDVSSWFHDLDSLGCRYISEVDCKDQFNNIKPEDVISHLTSACEWLVKKKRWRMSEVVWSVHKESKKLDRAGRGNSAKFWYITQGSLEDTVTWEMKYNNFILSAGNLWCRHGCIPMGGSFSAQAADLHSLWSVYIHKGLFRRLGTLRVTDSGFPYWENSHGRVSMQQFRDNILVASSYPGSPQVQLIQTICNILRQCWGLRVLCVCATEHSDACLFRCHHHSTQALGYCLVRGLDGQGSCYTHPSALDSSWFLKLGPPLLSPALAHPSYLPCLLTGVLSNSKRWCVTWAGELLSVAAWLQVAVLSGWPLMLIRRAAHSAIARGLSASQHDFSQTVHFMYHLLPHLPRRRCCILHLCLQWLRHRAIWVGDQYSSWALPPHLRVSGISGAWNGDWHALDYHRQSISPPGHQCSDDCRRPPPSHPSVPSVPSVPPATPLSPPAPSSHPSSVIVCV